MCTTVDIVIHEDHTKGRIKNTVKAYTLQWPDEYKAAKKQYKEWRALNRDQFGSVEGDHAIKRLLVHMPETLDQILIGILDDEEYEWLRELPQQLWFAKTFPEFRASETL